MHYWYILLAVVSTRPSVLRCNKISIDQVFHVRTQASVMNLITSYLPENSNPHVPSGCEPTTRRISGASMLWGVTYDQLPKRS